jgi:hypothetical protein
VTGTGAVDDPDMAPVGRRRPGDERGAPRILEHCAAVERMIGAQGCTAQARLEQLLGDQLAGLLCRALMSAPRPVPVFAC